MYTHKNPTPLKRSQFPKDFIFGTATSSYQIEGTDFGTCGPSHWDSFAKAGGTANHENGKIACAHYTHWQTDLDLIAEAGLDAYRFSTAWPRVQPNGKGQILQEGLDFYDTLIDGLLERDIEPHLTLYHWDLPQTLADAGGWANRDTVLYFGDYAAIISQKFGDRLNSIATINEPWCVAWLSHYLGHHAPGLKDLSTAAKAMHNILLAHGTGMQAMRAQFSSTDPCQLGIVLNMEYFEPASGRDADVYATQIQDGIYNRWFADALFNGAYPSDVLQYLEPHLPEGWQQDMALIAQPNDWLGLNYYTRNRIQDDGTNAFPYGVAAPSNHEELEKTSMGWEVYPGGLAYFLKRLQSDYTKDLPLIVSENGMASFDRVEAGVVDDQQRKAFFHDHMSAVKSVIDDGVPVQGYFAWSLLDNFEWAFGYDQRFGIVHVDFDTQERTPKESWHWLKQILAE